MEEEVNIALHNISQANNFFTFDLYKTLAVEPGNFFFSPLSIQIILALTFLGAKGNTARQMATGLHIGEDPAVVQYGVAALMNSLQEANDVRLDLANRIYLKAGYSIKEGFNSSASRFKAGVGEVDFLEEPKARKTINDWVENKTNHKIKEIIPSGVLNDLTRLVLVNTIYFKGDWQTKFKSYRTFPVPFHTADGSRKNVDMMALEEHLKYREISDLNSQVLLLPYEGERLGMLILLPRKINGLASLEEKLADCSLQDILKKLQGINVHVQIPKFKIEYSKELTSELTKLGMPDMFDDDVANFTGITDAERLKVDKVPHKSFFEANEDGTEAAAATGVIVVPLSGRFWVPPTVHFKADRPFVFLILDQQTKAVLFAGRFSDPTSAS